MIGNDPVCVKPASYLARNAWEHNKLSLQNNVHQLRDPTGSLSPSINNSITPSR